MVSKKSDKFFQRTGALGILLLPILLMAGIVQWIRPAPSLPPQKAIVVTASTPEPSEVGTRTAIQGDARAFPPAPQSRGRPAPQSRERLAPLLSVTRYKRRRLLFPHPRPR
jgi:hypothetical protein